MFFTLVRVSVHTRYTRMHTQTHAYTYTISPHRHTYQIFHRHRNFATAFLRTGASGPGSAAAAAAASCANELTPRRRAMEGPFGSGAGAAGPPSEGRPSGAMPPLRCWQVVPPDFSSKNKYMSRQKRKPAVSQIQKL